MSRRRHLPERLDSRIYVMIVVEVTPADDPTAKVLSIEAFISQQDDDLRRTNRRPRRLGQTHRGRIWRLLPRRGGPKIEP